MFSSIFLSISQIVWKLELPLLNMNTKQFSLYGTSLTRLKLMESFLFLAFCFEWYVNDALYR